MGFQILARWVDIGLVVQFEPSTLNISLDYRPALVVFLIML